MELQILKEFIKLCESGSFQETAEQMNLSPSTLSKHLHRLEEELGTALLDRSQRSMNLNENGRCFYPYALRTVQAWSEGCAELRERTQDQNGPFTVAYDPLLGQYGVPDVLIAFSTRFPQHELKAIESYRCLRLLEERKCCFAFVGESEAARTNCSKIVFKTDQLAIVLPDGHPLAGCEHVHLSEIAEESFILHSRSDGAEHDETRKFRELCAAEGIEPRIAAESHFTSTMLHYVRNGKGIAVLNRAHMPFGRETFAVVELDPPVETLLYFLYPKRIINPGAKAFLHYMIDLCSNPE